MTPGSKEMFRKDLKSKKRKVSKEELLLAAESKRQLKEAALADPEARVRAPPRALDPDAWLYTGALPRLHGSD